MHAPPVEVSWTSKQGKQTRKLIHLQCCGRLVQSGVGYSGAPCDKEPEKHHPGPLVCLRRTRNASKNRGGPVAVWACCNEVALPEWHTGWDAEGVCRVPDMYVTNGCRDGPLAEVETQLPSDESVNLPGTGLDEQPQTATHERDPSPVVRAWTPRRQDVQNDADPQPQTANHERHPFEQSRTDDEDTQNGSPRESPAATSDTTQDRQHVDSEAESHEVRQDSSSPLAATGSAREENSSIASTPCSPASASLSREDIKHIFTRDVTAWTQTLKEQDEQLRDKIKMNHVVVLRDPEVTFRYVLVFRHRRLGAESELTNIVIDVKEKPDLKLWWIELKSSLAKEDLSIDVARTLEHNYNARSQLTRVTTETTATSKIYYHAQYNLLVSASNSAGGDDVVNGLRLFYSELLALCDMIEKHARRDVPFASHDMLELWTTLESADEPHTQMRCTQCLEQFEIGDKLRRLPCMHVFHRHEIDRWLLESKKCCPECKRAIDAPPNPSSSAEHRAASAGR